MEMIFDDYIICYSFRSFEMNFYGSFGIVIYGSFGIQIFDFLNSFGIETFSFKLIRKWEEDFSL